MSKHHDMLVELLNYDPGEGQNRLTDWEVDFLEAMMDWLEYSVRQASKIEQIWNRIFG